MYIYIYIHTYIHTYTSLSLYLYIYIYIYRHRRRAVPPLVPPPAAPGVLQVHRDGADGHREFTKGRSVKGGLAIVIENMPNC